jgi:hypothetical protein
LARNAALVLDAEARPNGGQRFAAYFDAKRGSNSTCWRLRPAISCARGGGGRRRWCLHRRLGVSSTADGAGWRSPSAHLSCSLIRPMGPLAFRDTLSRCAPFRIVAGVAPWAFGEPSPYGHRVTPPACTLWTSHPHSSRRSARVLLAIAKPQRGVVVAMSILVPSAMDIVRSQRSQPDNRARRSQRLRSVAQSPAPRPSSRILETPAVWHTCLSAAGRLGTPASSFPQRRHRKMHVARCHGSPCRSYRPALPQPVFRDIAMATSLQLSS